MQSSQEGTKQLLDYVGNHRQRREQEVEKFLLALTPHLDAARKVNRELDFHTAQRFNALRYLRYDELGLSRIIADLLDPSGDHGQGTTFIKTMLELLSATPEGSDSRRDRVPVSILTIAEHIQVEVERTIEADRRIDITVDFSTREGDGDTYCLAFENKPYAGDQHEQCIDYLKFLKRKYCDRFLLVYMPSTRHMPSGSSLPIHMWTDWLENFCVLPYSNKRANTDDDHLLNEANADRADDGAKTDQRDAVNSTEVPRDFAVGDSVSLADWFQICSSRCNAERMRWFLREAQLFCQQHVGNVNMTDTEARYLRKYLEENPVHASAAYAIARAYPDYMNGVLDRFLQHLTEKIKEVLQEKGYGLQIANHFLNSGWAQGISIYSEDWLQYNELTDNHHSDRRTAILLHFHVNQRDIEWGVCRPMFRPNMTQEEQHRQENISELLKNRGIANSNDWWLHHEKPRKYVSLYTFVPELAQELNGDKSEITSYYVNGLIEFVNKAYDAINQVDGIDHR